MTGHPDSSDDLIAELAKLMATSARPEPAKEAAEKPPEVAAPAQPPSYSGEPKPVPTIRIPGMDAPVPAAKSIEETDHMPVSAPDIDPRPAMETPAPAYDVSHAEHVEPEPSQGLFAEALREEPVSHQEPAAPLHEEREANPWADRAEDGAFAGPVEATASSAEPAPEPEAIETPEPVVILDPEPVGEPIAAMPEPEPEPRAVFHRRNRRRAQPRVGTPG
jgi:hypothetical protein